MDKTLLKQLILEEMQNMVTEATVDPAQQKKMAIENVNKHFRLLKLLKSTIKQIKMPDEFSKMSEMVKNSNTPSFLSQFLGVKDDVPVKVEALLTNPLGVIQSVIDEVIGSAYKNAKQKLTEDKNIVGGIKRLGLEDPDMLKKKHDKKKKTSTIKEPIVETSDKD